MLRRALVLVTIVGGCGTESPPPEATSRLAVHVAPLDLAGVDDACYALSVFAGSDPETAPTVWSKSHICADAFGDGRGGLAYVGPCDADGAGASSVRLVLEDLCTGGSCGPTSPGPHSIAADAWRNPCPGPLGCVHTATCAPNADTPVTFDLVVARDAVQGFFDVAVEFSDVFCSAKLDCLPELLNLPGGGRGPTVVVALACTGGPASDVFVYRDNVVVDCYAPDGSLLGSYPYDVSLGPGNIGPGEAPFVFQAATYRTFTAATGVGSWSLALGIRPEDLPGRCVLETGASASGVELVGAETPAGAIYPFIGWHVTLSEAAGALSCGAHALDAPGSGVATDYVRGAPRRFSHVMHGADAAVSSPGRLTCETAVSLDGSATIHASPEGVTARVAGKQSRFYRLPAGVRLLGCCGDPCCEGSPTP